MVLGREWRWGLERICQVSWGNLKIEKKVGEGVDYRPRRFAWPLQQKPFPSREFFMPIFWLYKAISATSHTNRKEFFVRQRKDFLHPPIRGFFYGRKGGEKGGQRGEKGGLE